MRTLLVLVMLLVAVPTWAAPVAFEDVNCNGVFDAGDVVLNPGVPGNPPRDLYIFSEECLVVPAGSISAKPWASIFIWSEKHLAGGGLLATVPTEDSEVNLKGVGGLTWTSGGVTSGGEQYIGSENGPMVIGDGTRWTSKYSYVDIVDYYPALLSIGKGVVIRALYGSSIYSEGDIVAPSGLNVLISDPYGYLDIHALGSMTIDGATLKSNYINVETPATPLAVRNSRVRAVNVPEAFQNVTSILRANGVLTFGPLDVTGTQFPDVDPELAGDPIIGR